MSIHIKVTLPYLFLLQNKKKEHTTLCMFSFCMWSPILYFEVAIQSFELFRFHFFCNISIDVQCSWNIWMSECVLNDLYIYSSFTHSCCKCMSSIPYLLLLMFLSYIKKPTCIFYFYCSEYLSVFISLFCGFYSFIALSVSKSIRLFLS